MNSLLTNEAWYASSSLSLAKCISVICCCLQASSNLVYMPSTLPFCCNLCSSSCQPSAQQQTLLGTIQRIRPLECHGAKQPAQRVFRRQWSQRAQRSFWCQWTQWQQWRDWMESCVGSAGFACRTLSTSSHQGCSSKRSSFIDFFCKH